MMAEIAPPDELFSAPKNPETAAFVKLTQS